MEEREAGATVDALVRNARTDRHNAQRASSKARSKRDFTGGRNCADRYVARVKNYLPEFHRLKGLSPNKFAKVLNPPRVKSGRKKKSRARPRPKLDPGGYKASEYSNLRPRRGGTTSALSPRYQLTQRDKAAAHRCVNHAVIHDRVKARRAVRSQGAVASVFVTASKAKRSADLVRMALQAPSRLRATLPKEHTFDVYWDSCASVCITNDAEDFCGPLQPMRKGSRVQQLKNGLAIAGKGHVLWTFQTTEGLLRTLKLPAYYVPDSKFKLMSTGSTLQTYSGEKMVQDGAKMTLSGIQGDQAKGAINAFYNPRNNLPRATAYRYQALPEAATALSSVLSSVHNDNVNLTDPEKELLRWHYRLGHIGLSWVRFLLQAGVLARSQQARELHRRCCKLRRFPKCAACQFGKQTRRPAPGMRSERVSDRVDALRHGDLLPGQKVSVDHFVCSTSGRLFSGFGKSLEKNMYVGG